MSQVPTTGLDRRELLAILEKAAREGATDLDLSHRSVEELPEEIGKIGSLRNLDLTANRLSSLPETLGGLKSLETLLLDLNELTEVPDAIRSLEHLVGLHLFKNRLESLPDWIGELQFLKILIINGNPIGTLPPSICELSRLETLYLGLSSGGIPLKRLPDCLGGLASLRSLAVENCNLSEIPTPLETLKRLKHLSISGNPLGELPTWLGDLTNLQSLEAAQCGLSDLPASLVGLEALESLDLAGNSLNPALQSAYDAGLPELKAYLRSLDAAQPLYEAKLMLVGEGGVGKTTLLKALMRREGQEEPRKGEPTTHGVQIDIHALHLPHPEKDDVHIQLNAWDFGGQEVYRVTHQFFFSRRSIYLVVWEPRRGVGQSQVEDWLKLIRLRVGDDARVLIVSTHCRTGERIARIDQPVLLRDFGAMIVGFHEVDSLVQDPATGEKVGVAALKRLIGETAAGLEQMGMPFNRRWNEAREELLALPEPRVSYGTLSGVCAKHDLEDIDAETLAHLLHDLGYIVYYGDDERLRGDVVLQPEWLTKAIGFVLEDRTTQEMDGILQDDRLHEVWRDHPFAGETRYEPSLYPFFLRLMEKYDVSYRLPDGTASLVAQHVPQVRPELPWLPEHKPGGGRRRIAMVCTMAEAPPGLVPWMIVRTHDYAAESAEGDRAPHRLHWQKGVFLRHPPHGEALLELRGRELHIYTQAVWPEYLMNVIQHTLHKLIRDSWPGLEGRYSFTVPCPERTDGGPCNGRFNIEALRRFLAEGDRTIRCQHCHRKESIPELLFGFEDLDLSEQLRDIQARLDGLESRIANYVMALMQAIADEGKHGPRLFTLRPVEEGGRLAPRRLVSTRLRLELWCEAEDCQHKVFEEALGVYEFERPREWLVRVAPYANFIVGLLKTILPVAAPAVDAYFGKDTVEGWSYATHLDLAEAVVGALPDELEALRHPEVRPGMVNETERSGLLALHGLLRELDPNHAKLGLIRVPTYTGDYRWLCRRHYQDWESKIPEQIE